ncbi:hypothetical protein [Streptomyces sp. NPDC095613]|uniref:hypothetical protein n=1 Tax=Streptomyces sp. NPDC095613 TaxID=3155540 RepID=UPI00332A12CB
MHHAARDEGCDPDRISFTRTLRVVRRHVTGRAALFPSRLTRALTHTLREIRERLLPPRRLRSSARVIKRKMANRKLKRVQHMAPPRPDMPAVTIVGPAHTTPTRRKDT